jgi:hypothetical protein
MNTQSCSGVPQAGEFFFSLRQLDRKRKVLPVKAMPLWLPFHPTEGVFDLGLLKHQIKSHMRRVE